MNNLCIEFAPFAQQWGRDFRAYFAKELARLQEYIELGILIHNEKGLYTTPTGAMLIRNIAMVFDTYLEKSHKRAFSKTI